MDSIRRFFGGNKGLEPKKRVADPLSEISKETLGPDQDLPSSLKGRQVSLVQEEGGKKEALASSTLDDLFPSSNRPRLVARVEEGEFLNRVLLAEQQGQTLRAGIAFNFEKMDAYAQQLGQSVLEYPKTWNKELERIAGDNQDLMGEFSAIAQDSQRGGLSQLHFQGNKFSMDTKVSREDIHTMANNLVQYLQDQGISEEDLPRAIGWTLFLTTQNILGNPFWACAAEDLGLTAGEAGCFRAEGAILGATLMPYGQKNVALVRNLTFHLHQERYEAAKPTAQDKLAIAKEIEEAAGEEKERLLQQFQDMQIRNLQLMPQTIEIHVAVNLKDPKESKALFESFQ